MRTTISISDDLLLSAKRKALERNVSLGRVIEDALRAALCEDPRDAPPFRLVTFTGDGPWPGINLDRTSDLLDIEAAEDAADGA